MMQFRRIKQHVWCLLVILFCLGVLSWLTFSRKRLQEVFGSPNVIVASSHNLSKWLSLNTRTCKEHEEKTLIFRYLDVKLACQSVEDPCYMWYWDVANWTLIYTRQKMATNSPTGFCPKPIHGVRTAKIIYPDGQVEYPGCSNEKYPCAPMPLFAAFYDKRLQQRINRSPCCRKLLIDITHHMGRVFDKYNIPYMLLFGAVISLVRDNGVFIPYDTDIDVAINVDDIDKLEQAIPDLQKPGYIFKWKMEYTKGLKRYMIGCTNKQCVTGPGIALYSIKGDNIQAPVTNWRPLPKNLTLPSIRRKFEGLEMGFPKEPERFLDFYYGKDKWRTPFQCTEHYYDQCSA